MSTTNIGEPAVYGLGDFKAITIPSIDGTSVSLWHHQPKSGFPTIIYFHGNAGHLGHRSWYFRVLANNGFGLLALDYRGYGKSEGSPSEQGFYQDARATIAYAMKELSLKPQQIIVYGESIGTGVAVQMATEYDFAAIILQSPFTSLVTLGQRMYPYLPVGLLQEDRFDSLKKLGNVKEPLLLFHGELDKIVPFVQGKIMFENASEPKEAVFYPDKGHINMDINLMGKAVLDFSRKQGLVTLSN